MVTPRWHVAHSTRVASTGAFPVASWTWVFTSRVIAIIVRAMSFFGCGSPLLAGATWQYSQVTPRACA